jgi:hypothetical protein
LIQSMMTALVANVQNALISFQVAVFSH